MGPFLETNGGGLTPMLAGGISLGRGRPPQIMSWEERRDSGVMETVGMNKRMGAPRTPDRGRRERVFGWRKEGKEEAKTKQYIHQSRASRRRKVHGRYFEGWGLELPVLCLASVFALFVLSGIYGVSFALYTFSIFLLNWGVL